jgi:ABC-type spermidine/putrescine transport system permease subunit II
VKPETNAICTLMIASVALIVVTASLLSKRYAMSDEKRAALGAPM